MYMYFWMFFLLGPCVASLIVAVAAAVSNNPSVNVWVALLQIISAVLLSVFFIFGLYDMLKRKMFRYVPGIVLIILVGILVPLIVIGAIAYGLWEVPESWFIVIAILIQEILLSIGIVLTKPLYE